MLRSMYLEQIVRRSLRAGPQDLTVFTCRTLRPTTSRSTLSVAARGRHGPAVWLVTMTAAVFRALRTMTPLRARRLLLVMAVIPMPVALQV